MSWPPSQQWSAIISDDLPEGADKDKFRAAVDAAAWIYLASDLVEPKLWRNIITFSRAKAVTKLVNEIDRLDADIKKRRAGLPPNMSERLVVDLGEAVKHVLTLSRTLKQAVSIAGFMAGEGGEKGFASVQADGRREQLYSNLLIACTGPGALALSDSDEGPTNRMMRRILALLLPDPPNARGVRDIIRREIKRRRQLDVEHGEISAP